MFVRKKKNRSGAISIQVIDKSSGRYKVIKTIGSSNDESEIATLVLRGKEWIKSHGGQMEFDFNIDQDQTEQVLDNIEHIIPVGTDLLLTPIFNSIGFNCIPGSLLRQLSILRISHPVSKLKSYEYIRRYHHYDISLWQIYRYMDKLHKEYKEEIQTISYLHTQKILGGKIQIVFYDVTTLYFEIDNMDDLRKTGFSKEGRHQNPQILLGLLVSLDGYPLAYDIFEGNKYEGHTMLPVIESFKQKYGIKKLVVVADSGLMSADNVSELIDKGYEFILGARIKSESKDIKQKILSLKLGNGQIAVIPKEDSRLIVSYSSSRAKKDLSNRLRGLQKLEKGIRSGRLTKSNINNRGYNKYLKMEGEVAISIDKEKFEQDICWDGLKGYLTNSSLSNDQIIDNYKQLWHIEKAFRINKNDLKIRPVFHRMRRRIEAHICISFVAYKMYKELERQLKEKQAPLSPEKAIEIAESIYELNVKIPATGRTIKRVLLLSEEQKALAKMFGF
ncbi:IS1634 family transposase [Bacteroides sp. 51]|uniref:IS1634 family transposase n=1 Tax=Bacteroides sp. 51 TaxID=2302938 RepID=UPI0013D52BBF|nr:IS1634 family transposase [Bacteroides sp. 51]NDV84999.1 IS1634 family transposase [Bacteroides sp. 51]